MASEWGFPNPSSGGLDPVTPHDPEEPAFCKWTEQGSEDSGRPLT